MQDKICGSCGSGLIDTVGNCKCGIDHVSPNPWPPTHVPPQRIIEPIHYNGFDLVMPTNDSRFDTIVVTVLGATIASDAAACPKSPGMYITFKGRDIGHLWSDLRVECAEAAFRLWMCEVANLINNVEKETGQYMCYRDFEDGMYPYYKFAMDWLRWGGLI